MTTNGASRTGWSRSRPITAPCTDVGDPVIVVHTLEHAVAAQNAAADAARPVTLVSASNAGIYAGPGWWRELIAPARAAAPAARCTAILDCGVDAGATQAAIRA